MIKMELLRLYKSLYFYLCIILLVGFILRESYYFIEDMVMYHRGYPFILGTQTGIMTFIIPLLAGSIYGASYQKDFTSGVGNMVVTRCGYKKYYQSKVLVTFLSGFLLIVTSFAISGVVSYMWVSFQSEIYYISEPVYNHIFEYYQRQTPVSYFLIFTCYQGILAGIYALIGLCGSKIIKTTFLLYFTPFMVFIALTFIPMVLGQSLERIGFNLLTPVLKALWILPIAEPTVYMGETPWKVVLNLGVLICLIIVGIGYIYCTDRDNYV